MDFLFFTPPKDSFTVTPPIGQIYLATVLKQNGFTVEVLDCLKENLSDKKIIERLKRLNPKIIGFTIKTPGYNSVKKYIHIIKDILPDTKIAVGGAHSSALPEETFRDLDIDILVIGEAEDIIVDITHALIQNDTTSLRNINGIIYKENNNAIFNKGHNSVIHLNKIPIPDWTLSSPKEYPRKPAQLLYKSFPIGSIITSRGCKYHCTFCASTTVSGGGVRYRNTKLVVDEIEDLYKNHNVREFHFLDDNFAANKQHCISICNEIIKRKLKIKWKVPGGVRIDSLDEEILTAFVQSGCYQLGFGIESLDQNVLRTIKKGLNLKKLNERLKLVKKYHLETYGYFIIGLPSETIHSLKKTVNGAKKLPLDFIHFSMFTPMPGSQEYNILKQNHKLENIEWKEYYLGKGLSQSWCEVPYKTLKLYHLKAFILNIKFVFRIISRLKIKQYKYFISLIKSYF